MASKFGASRGVPAFDKFKTGLTYRAVWEMLMDHSDDPKDWKHKTRGVVLGYWHKLKLEMFYQATGIWVS